MGGKPLQRLARNRDNEGRTMIAIIISITATVLSFINLIVMIRIDKHIAEKGGKTIFWKEDQNNER